MGWWLLAAFSLLAVYDLSMMYFNALTATSQEKLQEETKERAERQDLLNEFQGLQCVKTHVGIAVLRGGSQLGQSGLSIGANLAQANGCGKPDMGSRVLQQLDLGGYSHFTHAT